MTKMDPAIFSNHFPSVLVNYCCVEYYPRTSWLETTSLYYLTQCLWVRTPGVIQLGGSGSGFREVATQSRLGLHHLKARLGQVDLLPRWFTHPPGKLELNHWLEASDLLSRPPRRARLPSCRLLAM